MSYNGDSVTGTYTYTGTTAVLTDKSNDTVTAIISGNNMILTTSSGTGFTLTRGSGSGGATNPFNGTTWSGSDLTLTFSSSTRWAVTMGFLGLTFAGTYTYSGNNAILYYDDGFTSGSAVISGNNLTLVLENGGTGFTLTRN
jgi:hypothetical protein